MAIELSYILESNIKKYKDYTYKIYNKFTLHNLYFLEINFIYLHIKNVKAKNILL